MRFSVVAVCVFLLSTSVVRAQFRENAENGQVNIQNRTDSAYPLIQFETVAEGERAFHLATPSFEANWFDITTDIPVSANSQLFFLSRLGVAAPSQVAKVQLSENGGSSFPHTIYSQVGSGVPGEGAFSLRNVPLADYAGQDVRLRFMLDYTGGLVYTDTNSRTGWFIDDIQVAPEFEKLQYTIGNPSGVEQEYLEWVNRARADAVVEAQRLANETNPSITNAYRFFDIDTADIVSQYEYYVEENCIAQNAQPLSFNEKLLDLSGLHSEDMRINEFQGHTSSSNPPDPFQPNDSLGNRSDRLEYSGALGENVFAYAQSVSEGHAGFSVDWGSFSRPNAACYNPAFSDDGMQNPAGHRINIHNGSWKEVGIGVTDGSGAVGPQIVTQNFGNPGAVTYITGVVYEDQNDNSFYDAGEGLGGVRVDVGGASHYAISTASGGYSIPVDGDGDYSVTFDGGGQARFQTLATVSDGLNVKVDYLVGEMPSLACDFDGDNNCSLADLNTTNGLFSVGDLEGGIAAVGAAAAFDLNNSGLVDGADLNDWLELAATEAGFAEAFRPGDANLNGAVDFADFLLLSASFGTGRAWNDGNFNGNEVVDFGDFLQLSANFGSTLPLAAASVPEPGTSVSAVFCCLGLLVRRRRRLELKTLDFQGKSSVST